MRQFVFGVVLAAMAWWGYGKWSESMVLAQSGGGVALANEAAQPPTEPGSVTSLVGLLGGDQESEASVEIQPAEAVAPPPPPPPPPVEKVEMPSDVEELLERLKQRDAGAVGLAWLAVASGRLGPHHDAVIELLRPRSSSFEDLLASLGSHNGFLRSPEGRAAAREATAAAMSLPDAQAIDAGTALIYLMTCGRIARGDVEWRDVVDEARQQHRVRVNRWLCNPTNVAGAQVYTVKSGDSLDLIARRFRKQQVMVEGGTLAVLNRISNPNSIQVGQRVKVPVAPITAVLEKDSFALMIFVGDQLLRLYWVGHGANDHTPVTEFEVVAKQAHPDWTAPDGNLYPYGHPENVLGEYFIKFGHAQYSGFGAHGTPEEDTICTESSMGCLRMLGPDIAELFNLLPRGAKVIVRDTAAR